MISYNCIPDFQKKEKNLKLPFDIDGYIANKYWSEKQTVGQYDIDYHRKQQQVKEKYKSEHIESELKKLEQEYNPEYTTMKLKVCEITLERQKELYNTWFNNYLSQLSTDISTGKAESKLVLPKYGPNYYYDEVEKFLMQKALDNIVYIIKKKGYCYNIETNEEQVVDFMKGNCIQCDDILTVRLK